MLSHLLPFPSLVIVRYCGKWLLQLRCLLFSFLQIWMCHPNWPRDSIEGHTAGLGRELNLGSYVKEREVASDKVMRDPGCFVQDIDLTA